MKNKILTFIIGVLVGAIIATAGFYIYSKNNSSDDMTQGNMQTNQGEQENNGSTPPDMPDSNGNGVPEKPDGDDNSIPQKPDGDDNSVPEKPSEEQNNSISE